MTNGEKHIIKESWEKIGFKGLEKNLKDKSKFYPKCQKMF